MGTVNKNALIRNIEWKYPLFSVIKKTPFLNINYDVGFIKKRMACKNRTCDPQIDISAALPTELMSFSS